MESRFKKRAMRSSRSRRIRLESLERRELLTTLDWSAGPSLPAARTDAAAITAPDKSVLVLGGSAAQPMATPRLTTNAAAWTAGQNIDTQRNDLGAVRSGNSILLFGGTGNTEGSNEVLSYDYRLGDSQDLAKMNLVRYDFGYAADADGRAYAFGGIGVFADGEIWSQAERYTPATNTWTAIAALPKPLHGMSAVGDGKGHVFVFGGSQTLDDSGIQTTSYKYDVATDTWSTVAPMPTGTRDSAAVITEAGEIFVIGGVATTGPTAAVQQYDPATNSWTAQTALPSPRSSVAATFDSGGRIQVAGGFDASGKPSATVYVTQNLKVPDVAPRIATSPVTTGSLDRPYTYDVNAIGNPVPTYSLVTAPTGMTIDAATGLVSWQPVAGQLGVHAVTVAAANRAGSVQQSFDITVVADTIAPTTPTIKVDGTTETTATLSWTASTDAGGVDKYEVYSVRRISQRFRKRYVYTLVATVPATTTSTTITGLTPLTSTSYTVQAVDTSGLKSARAATASATTLSKPHLTFRAGSQTSGTVSSPAKKPIKVQLLSRANPAATFSLVGGPATMTVNPTTGLAEWTPTVAEIGAHAVTFRATNSVGSADLTVNFDIVADVPQLSVKFNPATGETFAVAGRPFVAQVSDASSSPSTYSLVAAPTGMLIDPATGKITWTPVGSQGGANPVTVRGVNSGGTTDLKFSVPTLFTGAVSNVSVTGTSLAAPTVSWVAPTGEGSNLVTGYRVDGIARWRAGRARRSHQVSYTVAADQTSVLMTGMQTGHTYALTITPLDAAGNPGLANVGTTVASNPALPLVRATVSGFSGGSKTPGPVVAGQPMEIALVDQRPDPSNITLVSGPAGLTFDPATKLARWTPTVADITSGYTSHTVTFQASNSVGSVTVNVPVRVLFSGAVRNATAVKGNGRGGVRWDPPVDNAKPIAGYRITRYWTWSGRHRSSTWTVGNVTSVTFGLIPTGAVVHRGASVVPIDADGNLGADSGFLAYGAPPNNFAPVAKNDSYTATEDTPLVVNATDGVRSNDTDADNSPFNSLNVVLRNRPLNGTVSLSSSGAFTYTPNANFNGRETFTYVATDGKFTSNPATVTIDVAAVNDAPTALDDHYTVNQDTPLVVPAGTGVLANDVDVDGDPITVSIVARPAGGSVLLQDNGAFQYTPGSGFSGKDTFTYVATDTQLNSRVATVTVDVKAAQVGTKFFVVDYGSRGTYEYDAAGQPVESYGLPKANRKPLGVASNANGSLVWVVDKQKQVFVYDDAGKQLGTWVPRGLDKPDGIATDGTDVWIVDRSFDRVYYYKDGANRRNGDISPTSSFALHAANRNPKGITTDGKHVWTVNNRASRDEVFKYTVAGQFVGKWTLDAANSTPTGITIDPTNVRHVWVVDSGTDRVYQYDDAAARTTGTATASSSFALGTGNANPQGIADPRSGLESRGWARHPATVTTPAAHWENPENARDVNDDGIVSPIDVLLVINHLNRSAPRDAAALDEDNPFVDVNADGTVAPSDALTLINFLNEGRRGHGEAVDSALTSWLDEPAAPLVRSDFSPNWFLTGSDPTSQDHAPNLPLPLGKETSK